MRTSFIYGIYPNPNTVQDKINIFTAIVKSNFGSPTFVPTIQHAHRTNDAIRNDIFQTAGETKCTIHCEPLFVV